MHPYAPTPRDRPAPSWGADAFPPPRPTIANNIPGLIGLVVTAVTALLSPTGILGVTLCLLVPLGAIGMVFSLIGCFFRPRRYGVIGLCVGLATLLFWGAIVGGMFWYSSRQAAAFGLTPVQYTDTTMSCSDLVEQVETIRSTTGAIPKTFDVTALPDVDDDPWGHPYRYVLTSANAYGYTFMSDGPDGVAGTADDLDLIAIHPTDGTFELPPPPAPSAPTGSTTPATPR